MLAKAYVSRGTSALSAGEFDEAELNVDHALALVDDYAPALTLKEKIDEVRPRTDEQCGRSELVGAGPRATCRDPLSDGTNGPSNGPSMVVVPVGGAFSRPFAIGKYEITIKEFNHYCRASGECASIQGSTDTAPATGIAIADAERMASWLSEQTGWTYRLPTSAEWLWAAQANGQPQKGDLNCLVGNPGNPTKGAMLRDVRSGDPNGWGLLESVGNAREWAKDGGTLMAHGGARTDRLEACKPELSKSHSGEAGEVTGFRFVREIGG
ncbi:MAG: SUMF1/EgtB/PvdO family nonheme iron enzyme [Haliea sp.]|nr:SUMF1/EgtB/PvdO family nonheme iron enzyme [Haliea sp.]